MSQEAVTKERLTQEQLIEIIHANQIAIKAMGDQITKLESFVNKQLYPLANEAWMNSWS